MAIEISSVLRRGEREHWVAVSFAAVDQLAVMALREDAGVSVFPGLVEVQINALDAGHVGVLLPDNLLKLRWCNQVCPRQSGRFSGPERDEPGRGPPQAR